MWYCCIYGNAEYAKSVLTSDRHISCIMPFSMAVWEADDGKVYLSEMNMALMAKCSAVTSQK